MRAAIVAITQDRVIGVDGKLPWHYSADLKRFKRLTLGATIIMGRGTWESIGAKPLAGRRNVVITRSVLDDVQCYTTIPAALATCTGDVWFIGGGQLYAAALEYCDFIDVTQVPDKISAGNTVFFPELDPSVWQAEPMTPLAEDPRLGHGRYYRRSTVTETPTDNRQPRILDLSV